jgi:hypothetical protein
VSDSPKEFTKNFVVQNNWMRVGSLTDDFAEMAEEAYGNFLAEMGGLEPELDENGSPYRKFRQESRITKLGIKSIVFTAMALEAGIFELAAIHLGEKVAGYLDKLDLKSKWLIAPQLVCGRSFDESGPALNNLNSLIKARNKLVHHKSTELKGYRLKPGGDYGDWTVESVKEVDDQFDKLTLETKQFIDSVKSSFKTLIYVSLELELLIKDAGPLPGFSQAEDDENELLWGEDEGPMCVGVGRSDLIKKVIGDCRAAHKKYHLKKNPPAKRLDT